MASVLAQRVFHWPRSSLSRGSQDKNSPLQSPKEQQHFKQQQHQKQQQQQPQQQYAQYQQYQLQQQAQKPTHHSHVKKPETTSRPSKPKSKPPQDPNTAIILVGPKKHRFKMNRKLLCSVSPFFSERLDDPSSQHRSVSLWLPGEIPSMFALFDDWLHSPRHHFRRHLDLAIAVAQDRNGPQGLHGMHWALIRLHLFASHLSLYHLQDTAMDALQDLYLKCDWDVPPGLVAYLYTKCEALPAVRLRRWAVAMMAFSINGTGSSGDNTPSQHYLSNEHDSCCYEDATDAEHDNDDPQTHLNHLIDTLPELADDYAIHAHKMSDSGLDTRFKNPQLRIPANRLRNDERAFGFRECSFHSHRATVGERRCPHERKRLRSLAAAGIVADMNTEVEDQLANARKSHAAAAQLAAREPSPEELGAVPRPLFSRDGAKEKDLAQMEEEKEKALKHVRSVSSTLK